MESVSNTQSTLETNFPQAMRQQFKTLKAQVKEDRQWHEIEVDEAVADQLDRERGLTGR